MTRLRHRVAAAAATSVSVAAIAAGCSSGSSDDSTAPADPSSTPPAATTTRPSAGSATANATDPTSLDYQERFADAGPLMDLYDRLHELTDGALDPLVGRDLELLGYDATYSLTPASDAVREIEHQRRARWTDLQRDRTTIITDRPVLLDVGAAGKGRLVDLVAQTLSDAGVRRFVVDAGGDLCHHGDEPLRRGP